ncbi:MAG: hypothetical protein HYU02_05370 [Thaumarchaeota archaeon]|nr:hypothetical protein [Nitrososphaerota archaeon]
MNELLLVLPLALVLGFKHSFDADHVIAVSAILTRLKSIRQSVAATGSWAVGHMITAGAITFTLFTFRETILSAYLALFESAVGLMLVVLGAVSLFSVFGVRVHSHTHKHDEEEEHSHFHMHIFGHGKDHSHRNSAYMFGVGIVQGLASNDELLVLVTASLGLATFAEVLVGIGTFSIGVAFGMAFYGLGIGFAMTKIRNINLWAVLNLLAGAISIAYGAMLFTGLV